MQRSDTQSQISEDAQNAQAGYDVVMLKVIEGSLEDLPAMPSNTVRIFLSSTFTGECMRAGMDAFSQTFKLLIHQVAQK